MPGESLHTDKELFRQIAAGHEPAFSQLYELYKERIYAAVFKMTRQELMAEEVVQEVFLNIWRKRSLLAEVENPSSYLFTMVYRRVYSHFKKLALDRKLLKVVAETKLAQNYTDEAFLAQESERLIHKAIDQLPPQQQTVFRLARLEGLSRQEIADQLQISPNTVKNHLADAIRSIRTYLDKAVFSGLLLLWICQD